jgi:hypothetical protein
MKCGEIWVAWDQTKTIPNKVNNTLQKPNFYHDFLPCLAEDIKLYSSDILESDAVSIGQQFYPSANLDIKHEFI